MFEMFSKVVSYLSVPKLVLCVAARVVPCGHVMFSVIYRVVSWLLGCSGLVARISLSFTHPVIPNLYEKVIFSRMVVTEQHKIDFHCIDSKYLQKS